MFFQCLLLPHLLFNFRMAGQPYVCGGEMTPGALWAALTVHWGPAVFQQNSEERSHRRWCLPDRTPSAPPAPVPSSLPVRLPSVRAPSTPLPVKMPFSPGRHGGGCSTPSPWWAGPESAPPEGFLWRPSGVLSGFPTRVTQGVWMTSPHPPPVCITFYCSHLWVSSYGRGLAFLLSVFPRAWCAVPAL